MTCCDECTVELAADLVHEFENGAGKTIGRVCRACCPRCDVASRVVAESVP